MQPIDKHLSPASAVRTNSQTNTFGPLLLLHLRPYLRQSPSGSVPLRQSPPVSASLRQSAHVPQRYRPISNRFMKSSPITVLLPTTNGVSSAAVLRQSACRHDASPPISARCAGSGPISVRYAGSGPISVRCARSGPISVRCSDSVPISAWCAGSGPISTWCTGSRPIRERCAGSGPISVRCARSGPISARRLLAGVLQDQSLSLAKSQRSQHPGQVVQREVIVLLQYGRQKQSYRRLPSGTDYRTSVTRHTEAVTQKPPQQESPDLTPS